ncbi:zinc-dependent alcohol dehydrogenase [Herbaspirillum camelliae]|uniref:zinc-dependent alcohol dehydrogenase n=1 Tax=Herbaspirillum camelliae TaxID=1892903 RepID=UPI000949EBBD|nr:zinc-dependent alcohol dehydrogenase [Herbaspirillum camelliae]
MRALLYHSAHDVRGETVPDPIIQEADDVILKVTATAICGSDLHLYRGKIPATRAGDILGHEFMGVVVETGPAVKRLKKGDRVVVPFVIACGQCFFCDQHLYAACETTNPDRGALMNAKGIRSGAAMFGYSHLYGGMPGGQAEYVRVPKADVGPICIDSPLADEQVLFLSDILPTGYQAVKNAGVREGSTIAIYGAGPVGQMAAASARMLGAEKIFMVDHHAYRLRFAQEQYDVIPVNFDQVDPAEYIIANTAGRGVDGVIDAVGFEAKGSVLESAMTTLKLEGSSGQALRHCIASVRRGGVISVPGLYAGFIHGFLFGDIFEKGVTVKTGQTHVQHYMPELLASIEEGRLRPEAIITHRLPLEDAARGYQIFNDKLEECRKVVLTA